MPRLPGLCIPLAAAALSACAVGPNYHAPRIDAPAQFVAAASPAPAGVSEVDLAQWWRALKDPELDSLIERAISGNPDVLIALERLQAARTYEVATVGTLLPQGEASAGAAHGTGSDLARGRASQALVSADNTAGFTHIDELGGFDASWQLDVFGKYRREIEAAHDDTGARRAARNAVLVAVISDVARAYVDLRGLQMRAAVLDAAARTLREAVRIVGIRYQRGITNELDVTLANRELATLEAQAAPVAAQVQAAEYTLATLLGRYPQELTAELDTPGLVPSVPVSMNTGVPLELLRRRPDIQQSERELAGASARIGVATASLFPSLALTGAIGEERQALTAAPPLARHIWSVGPGLLWPLLDFGALDAQVEIADREARARLLIYRQNIQQAVREVDSNVGLYDAEQVSLGKLDTALQASARAVYLAGERYDRGLTDYLNVVDAERQQYDIQQQYIAGQVAAAEEFIALYRSLGGGWEHYQDLPPIHWPQPAIIAMFTRLVSRNPVQ